MMKLSICGLLACSMILLGCSDSKSDDVMSDEATLIFGSYAGECSGDCSDVYILDKSSLAVDGDNRYPTNDFFVGNFLPLPESDFNIAKALLAIFPTDLLNETAIVLGCPDCADQGGYYLEYQTAGFHAAWRIDTNLDEVPSYLHAYITILSDKINLLPKQ